MSHSRRTLTLVFWPAIALVVLVAGCGRSPAPAGVTQSREQFRIVALSPAVGVMLRDIGLAHLVVAKHDYDMALPDHVPAVGHQEAIDYEALLRARPTHVLIEWGSRPLPPRLEQLAEERDWVVKRIGLLTLDDIAETVDDLAITFGAVDFGPKRSGRPAEAPEGVPALRVPRFEDPASRFSAELPSARLARAWSRRGDGFEAAGRVLLLGAVDPPGVLGPGSFHHQILERIGGVPAVRDGAAWMELDAEDIQRLAPDGIVLVAPRDVNADGAATRGPESVLPRLGRIGELDISAVRSGRIALIDDPLSLTPSTAMARFADELASVLEGWNEKP